MRAAAVRLLPARARLPAAVVDEALEPVALLLVAAERLLVPLAAERAEPLVLGVAACVLARAALAAVERLRERGLQNAPTEEIAREAGMSQISAGKLLRVLGFRFLGRCGRKAVWSLERDADA